MLNSPRYWPSATCVAMLLPLTLGLPGKPALAADNQIIFIFGGDVEWSLNQRPPTVRYRIIDPTPYGKLAHGRDVRDQVTGDWPPIPHVEQGESGAYLKSLGLKDPSDASPGESLSFPLPPDREDYTEDYSTDDVLLNRPLRRLAPIFHTADLVMVNNEGALSDHGRQVGANKTPERFAINFSKTSAVVRLHWIPR